VTRDLTDVIDLFARKEKRERLIALSEKASRRADFLDAFLHDRRSLDPRVLAPLAPHGLSVDRIVAQVGKASDAAHCLGGVGDDDGRDATLVTLLTANALRSRDLLIYDLVTRRAYYENHEGECFVLRSP